MRLYCISIIATILAFLWLRYKEEKNGTAELSEESKLMKLPFSFGWCCVICVPPFILCCIGIFWAHWQYLVATLIIVVVCVLLAFLWRRRYVFER